jgi:pimeloyl-[acyl-carrier protein] methyl ester esterase
MKKHLVMLHGFGTDSHVFASIGAQLSLHYDVMMVDLPGHGETKEAFGSFSYCGYAILHALKQYVKEPYSLLGWSMGGIVALDMIKQEMEHKCKDHECKHDHSLIENLILVSSTPKFVASDDFNIGMNKAVFSKFKKGVKETFAETMDDFYKLMFADNEDGSIFLPEIKMHTPPQSTLLDCLDSFEIYDGRKTLPQIKVPTLILAGDKDKIIDPKASLYMSQEIKNSNIKIFKDAGHAPHLTRESEVVHELKSFLG